MSDKKDQKEQFPRAQDRARREAALRDNLLKRKQQSRARDQQEKEKE